MSHFEVNSTPCPHSIVTLIPILLTHHVYKNTNLPYPLIEHDIIYVQPQIRYSFFYRIGIQKLRMNTNHDKIFYCARDYEAKEACFHSAFLNHPSWQFYLLMTRYRNFSEVGTDDKYQMTWKLQDSPERILNC